MPQTRFQTDRNGERMPAGFHGKFLLNEEMGRLDGRADRVTSEAAALIQYYVNVASDGAGAT